MFTLRRIENMNLSVVVDKLIIFEGSLNHFLSIIHKLSILIYTKGIKFPIIHCIQLFDRPYFTIYIKMERLFLKSPLFILQKRYAT